jgi:1-acyl-sn-glycerol-3-phosphate acyltransferase
MELIQTSKCFLCRFIFFFAGMSGGQNKPSEPFIDIREVIRKKNPALLRWMPRFILNYIKRILHEDEINDFIRRNGHLYNVAFVDAIVNEFGAKVQVHGLEHIPADGGVILAANHPLGGLDAMALTHVAAKRRPDPVFIVNDILLNLENLKQIFIPVNKHGRNSAEVVKAMNEAFESDKMVMVFPAGLVSRKQDDGSIADLEWKKSFVTKARQYQRPVIPVYIKANNSARFYNLARWRKKLGIKANIEMFFLVDEMYRQRRKTINITFGKPVSVFTDFPGKSDQVIANEIRKQVYHLSGKSHAHS